MTATTNQPFPWPTNFDGVSNVSGSPGVVALQAVGASTLQPGEINVSSIVNAGTATNTKTSTATALATTVGQEGILTLSATGITSGNGWGSAGLTTMSGTVTGGAFIFGSYGKLILSGTENHADSRMAAAFFKVDASSGTCTAGQLSGIWVDMGTTGPAGGFANGQTNIVRATNTTSSSVNAIIYGYGKATYAADLSDNGGGWAFTTGAPATAAGGLKINLNGNTRYIALLSDVGTLA